MVDELLRIPVVVRYVFSTEVLVVMLNISDSNKCWGRMTAPYLASWLFWWAFVMTYLIEADRTLPLIRDGLSVTCWALPFVTLTLMFLQRLVQWMQYAIYAIRVVESSPPEGR